MMTLGNTILKYRKELGITQESLAQQLEVTNQAVSKWESDQCCPDIALLPRLADIFGITMDELFGREPKEKSVTKVDGLPWPDDGSLRGVLFQGWKLIGHGKGPKLQLFFKNKVDGDVYSDFSVVCEDVDGDVNAAGAVQCGHVNGDVDAGTSVLCDSVNGDVDAGGNVQCADVEGRDVTCQDVTGDVDAGGDVKCGNVVGNVDAGGDVSCTSVGGNIEAGGDVTCQGDVDGYVEAGGDVTCGNVCGNISAEGDVTIEK